MDRKKFILSSSFFLLGMNFLKASTLIPSSCFQEPIKGNTNINLLLKKAADLRKSNFVKKQNKGAMSRRMFFSSPINGTNNIYAIYDQILEDSPTEIRAYNGKRKLMLQESESVLDIVNMYLKGVELNSHDALFKDRLAKEYLRVLTGSFKSIKSLPSPLNNKKELLDAIEKYYVEAIALDSNNQQLLVQLEKLRELKGLGFFEVDSRKNKQLKHRKKANKALVRNENRLMTSSDHLKKIKRLNARDIDDYRNSELQLSEKKYIKSLQKEKNYAKAVEESVKYYKRNPEDVDGLKLVRITLKKNKRYDLLESIERDNNKRQNTLWSHIALFNVLMKRIELTRSKNYTELDTILLNAKKLAEFNNEKFELKCKELFLGIYKKTPSMSQQLLEYGQELVGLRVPYRIDRYTRLCVDYYMSIGEIDKALTAIDIVVSLNTDSQLEDSILDTLRRIAEFREKTIEGQDEELIFLKQKLLNA
ncbi:hypothetical protein [Myroides odoratimimus]|uniref:hypothetical protein n=1 Tax=Myroides odoratimimus TaxID=76832 RepID=UPI00046A18ED|nr:hypothetical protein [Myroides odoratimimus]